MVSDSKQVILILRPLKWFGIVGAELKRVASASQSVMANGTVRSELVDIQQDDLHKLAELCEQLRHDSLYTRYANKKVFRHEEDFWTTKEKTGKGITANKPALARDALLR